MNLTEKEQLEYALEIIEDLQEGNEISEVENAFSLMNQCDLANHKKLWEKLRNALRNNKYLNEDYMTRQLRCEPNVKEGRWWWDPELW